MNVVGYARVSTEEQAKGQSVDSQIYWLKKWSEEQGWRYLKDYADAGISGGKEDRPALQQLLLEVDSFDAVLFTATDRLSRDADLAFSFIRTMFQNNVAVGFLPLSNYGLIKNLDDPFLNLILRQFASLDEFFRKLTQWKTKKGMEKLSREGRHMGKPPTYFKVKKTNGKLHLNNPVLLEIYRLAEQHPLPPHKRPYRYYSTISQILGLPYFHIYRAIKNKDKYQSIAKVESKAKYP